jgi:phospholipid/cholesterol/gamma-HCH transport system substrate-binding protein
VNRRLATTIAALGTATMILAGCGTSTSGGFGGVYDLPLPGGADVGSHPYTVTAQFADVLDLVPQASVKVNDVAVGRVESITLPKDGWTANVTMLINGDVHLPANATASLQQTSLLGEKYVELAPPSSDPQGTLIDNATIPLTRTNRNPEVEEVFGALSMLLNGGGIGQLQTIDKELNTALSGNEPQIRSLLTNIDQLVGNLDSHRQDITDALDGINQLAGALANRDQQIGNVLQNLAPGLRVLDQQRQELVTMLDSLNTLSGVAVDTVDRSEQDMVADLQALAPTLRELANAGAALPQALQVMFTYPFTDAVLDGTKGSYLNLYLHINAETLVMTPDANGDGGFTDTLSPGADVSPLMPAVPPVPNSNGAQAQKVRLPPLPIPSASGTVSLLPSTAPSTGAGTSSPVPGTTTRGGTTTGSPATTTDTSTSSPPSSPATSSGGN